MDEALAILNANLLLIRIEMEGMIAENRAREIEDKCPAYGEEAFMDLNQKIKSAFEQYSYDIGAG